MKVLKIDKNIGYYINEKDEWKEIIDIGKEDIYHLLDLVADNEVEMDLEDDNSNKIVNEAGKIIYTNLRTELNKLISSKETLSVEIESVFNNANEQYKKDCISTDDCHENEMDISNDEPLQRNEEKADNTEETE